MESVMKTLCENSQPMQRFTMESVMKTLCENSQPMQRNQLRHM